MIPSHYPEVLSEIRESLSSALNKVGTPDRDKKGLFTLGAASKLRNLAAISFLVEKDKMLFRSSLVKATDCRVQLIDRFDAGDQIPPSVVSMMLYQKLLDALASADLNVAKTLGKRMGGRPAVELKYDREFEIAFGYALKAILEDDDIAATARIDDLERSCVHEDYQNFAGCAPVLRAIVTRDSVAFETVFPQFLVGQRRESNGRGLFSDAPDKYLSIWGIGLINLAKSRGMDVEINDPLIPTELVN